MYLLVNLLACFTLTVDDRSSLIECFSVSESLLCEELLKREDLEDTTAENDKGFDNREENNTVIDLDVRLSEFIFSSAVHLLILNELVSTLLDSFNLLLQAGDMDHLSGILLFLLIKFISFHN